MYYLYPSEKHSVLQLLKGNLRLIFFTSICAELQVLVSVCNTQEVCVCADLLKLFYVLSRYKLQIKRGISPSNSITHYMFTKFHRGYSSECPSSTSSMTVGLLPQNCPTHHNLRAETGPTDTSMRERLYGPLLDTPAK